MRYDEMMFTPAVEKWQGRIGSKGKYGARYAEAARQTMGPDEMGFLCSRSSIYIASVSETGWPYVQHRGGPVGFIKQLDETTIGFADYAGNRQLISAGNLEEDDRVSVFAMDYPRQGRLKMQGHAKMLLAQDHPALVAKLQTEGQGRVERIMTLRIVAHDWNCPKYITPRFDQTEMTQLVGPELDRLEARIAALEAENAALKAEKG